MSRRTSDWSREKDGIRRAFEAHGSSEHDLIHVLVQIGLSKSGAVDLVKSSGAVVDGRVDMSKFLATLESDEEPPSGECRFRIFHINDVYVLDNFPALKTCIDKLSEEFPKSNVLTTLAGDFLAPSLLSSIDHGRGMVNVMNAIPVHAVCFGNHESDVPHESLMARIREFKGTWLNSNMRTFNNKENLPPGKLPDNHLVELDGGRSVALIGLCVGGGKAASLYRNGAFNGHAAKITPVLDAVDDAVTRARIAYPKIDCVIPLTHQDMPDDLELCSRDFPVVLGGHDHGVFNETRNGTLVIKAGEDAFKVAVIDIVWAADAPPAPAPPTRVSVELIQLGQPPQHNGPPMELKFSPHPRVVELVKRCQKPAEDMKSAVLATLQPGKYSSVDVRKCESTMATLLCTAMRSVRDCDGALVNAGNVRGNKIYESGKIYFSDLTAECPFPSTNIIVSMEGSVLSAGVAHSRQPWKRNARGSGKRDQLGASADALHCDDKMRVDPSTFAVLEVNGQSLIPGKVYEILIDSYLMECNPVFKEYADQYPERVPPEDSGQPALPIIVQYFCDKIWLALLDTNEDGKVNLAEVNDFFAEVDEDQSGDITEDELLHALKKRTENTEGAARVISTQCIGFADLDKNSRVSKKEIVKFMKVEIGSRQASKNA